MVTQVTTLQVIEMIEKENAVVIDIRDPGSFANGHIENATRVDNDNFQSFIESADKNIPIIVCCYHGNSSIGATEAINNLGYKGFSLQGGMSGWMLANPVVQGG